MSWNRFDELKTFAWRKQSAPPVKARALGGARTSAGKRKRSLNDSLNFAAKPVEGDIGGFSSEEDIGVDDCQSNLRFQRKHKRTRCSEDRPGMVDINTYDDCEAQPDLKQANKHGRRTMHNRHFPVTEQDLGITASEDIAWSASSSDEDDHENQEVESSSDPAQLETPESDSQPQSSQEKQSRSTADVIGDFASSHSDDSGEEDVDIMTPTLSTTATPDSPSRRGAPKRGSEWIRQVQRISEETPHKSDNLLAFDSAKKKKKFTRCGLAEQLQRLINREKSEKAFWAHRIADLQREENGQLQENKGAVTVTLVSCHAKCGLHVSRCRVLSQCEQNALPPYVDVLFDCVTVKQLQLHTTSVVRIHPPWQKLEVCSSPFPVLLCVYFCEKVPSQPVSSGDFVEPRPGCRLLSQPAVPFPVKVFRPTKLHFGGSDTGRSHDNILVSSLEGPGSSSVTFVRSGTYPSNPALAQGAILKAVQSQGGCSGTSVSFRATVQRVNCSWKSSTSPLRREGPFLISRRLKSSVRMAAPVEEIRWTLLVQDEKKVFGEIQIPPRFRSVSAWNDVIVSGEGKAFIFQHLRVCQRADRSRCPRLFSLIDSLWANEEEEWTSNQTPTPEVEDGSSSVVNANPPSFCFVLTAQHESIVTPCECVAAAWYKPVLCRTLKNIVQSRANAPVRVSAWCRLLHAHGHVTEHTATASRRDAAPGFSLFVTDASLPQQSRPLIEDCTEGAPMFYVKIEASSSCVLPEGFLRILENRAKLIFLKDLRVTTEGELKISADGYSVITRKASLQKPCGAAVPAEELTLSKIFLPSLVEQTEEDSLCCVEGTVTGVNEESACCWLVCDTCGNADITSGCHGSPYYCVACSREVTSPKTKTHLEVFVRTKSAPTAHVHLKLLQSSVESLLPVLYQDSEEGYDIELVVGKQLGPLNCHVDHRTNGGNTFTFKLTQISTF